jgi:hypothetical protein
MDTLQFQPYGNEAEVLQVGGLMIENRLDRITVSGDIDLTLDQAGLAAARQLHAIVGAVLARLESTPDLPPHLPPPPSQRVDNPFA